MKTIYALFLVPLLAVLAWSPSPAQPSVSVAATPPPAAPSAPPIVQGPWTTGAQGTLGDLTLPAGVTTTIDLATTGQYDPVNIGWMVILDYNTLTIPAGAILKFHNHPSGAPVVIRARGTVIIAGTINIDGERGHYGYEIPHHSEPGPGGFRGGTGNVGSASLASAGNGPGGAFVAYPWPYNGSGGSYASFGGGYYPGDTYGSVDVLPLIGGSGGSGNNNAGHGGGGAGGGAILIGSNTSIQLSGSVLARGGDRGDFNNGGSGGAIRLASPIINNPAGVAATLSAAAGYDGGTGRIRIECNGTYSGAITCNPPAVTAQLSGFIPANPPTITIVSWLNPSTGQWISINQDPTTDPANAEPLPSTGQFTVRVEGRGIPSGMPIEVRTTYREGDAVADRNHTLGETPGAPPGALWTDVPVNFQLGVSTVQVRTR